jgi:hypothetical protein
VFRHLLSPSEGKISANLEAAFGCVGAFRNCWHLEAIAIPSSLTSLSDFSFTGCTAMARVTFCAGSNFSVVSERPHKFGTESGAQQNSSKIDPEKAIVMSD